jgi:LacI family transcriptional regulator
MRKPFLTVDRTGDADAPPPGGQRCDNSGVTARRASTLTEVAHRAGVSLTTASKAINGQARISEETRARVLQAARELSFTPNPMARSLISGRSGTVALVSIDSLSQRFVVPIMLGAEAALSEIDLTMISTDARGDRTRLNTILTTLRSRKVDGVLLIGDNNTPLPSVTAALDRPIVYLYAEAGPRDIVHVPDDREGGRMVTEHLLGLGRRTVAQVMGPSGTLAVTKRVDGAAAGFEAHGRAPAAPTAYGPWSQRWGRVAARRLLAERPDVDGVVCGSDQIAAGVVETLLAAGRRIPDDVAVTGYDNWPIFAHETDPPLTTVDMNLEALGAAAVRDLFGVIDGVPVGGGIRRHDCSLIVRGSTVAGAGELDP